MKVRANHKRAQRPAQRRGAITGLAALMLVLASSPAFAYLDPSTGSMIVSAIIGIFASVALAVKTYWYKLKGLFRGKRGPAPDEDTSGEA
ncbi:hypothetical protein [Elongatibacter sediminis]|uniref:Uncharacterized protein n=1 Tax=Elongatibacter sediminis TaxID=3119006 RepID=A0AAW9RA45_9GAMM